MLITVQSLAILLAPFVVSPLLSAGVQWVFLFVLSLWLLSFLFFLFSFRHLVVKDVLEPVQEKDLTAAT